MPPIDPAAVDAAIAELRDAVAKMTPGEWVGEIVDDPKGWNLLFHGRDVVKAGDALIEQDLGRNGGINVLMHGSMGEEDLNGIVALRNRAMPLIDALRERLAEAERELSDLRKSFADLVEKLRIKKGQSVECAEYAEAAAFRDCANWIAAILKAPPAPAKEQETQNNHRHAAESEMR